MKVTLDLDEDPVEQFSAQVTFQPLYVIGAKRSRKNLPVIGHVWHIIGETTQRWSTGTPVPLCQGLTGYHRHPPVSIKGMSLKYDRLCKTCLRVVESRARARGVR